MTTTTQSTTLQKSLDAADLNTVADILRKIRLGTLLSPIKVVVAAIGAGVSFDITSLAFKAFCTVSGVEIPVAEGLPAILVAKSLRVQAGAALAVGSYILGDVGATLLLPPGGASTAVGVARLSDDGTTISFEATSAVTGFTFEYIPRSFTALSNTFDSPAP
jgi:hypothetical protein